MFNHYTWNLYLKAGGTETVDTFRSLAEDELNDKIIDRYLDTIKRLHRDYCPSRSITKEIINEGVQEVLKDLKAGSVDYTLQAVVSLPDYKYGIQSIMSKLHLGIMREVKGSEQDVFSWFSSLIEYYSTFFYILDPYSFLPYYFRFNFNVLEIIANQFGIMLPPKPKKKDYSGRFYYYGEVCGALWEFAENQNLTPYEICAFLYEFAPKYIGGIDSYIIKTLPDPKSAYFIGGSENDLFFHGESDSIECWQCNPDTRAGDMIVMYLKTPVSAIDSIWRSVSIGFNDPFFYYYRCTYMAKPVAVKRLSLKQMNEDELLRNMPIVRKNMQGVNGVELKPSEYNHLLDITGANALKLEFYASNMRDGFANEKDVEEKLVKPLLNKLGYAENEYAQQLYIEIGNHNKALIPDFVLLPDMTRGHQSAYAVIEAKYKIDSIKTLETVKIQARSYARQLNVEYSIIASKDKLWITSIEDDYTKTKIEITWTELNNADKFSSLYKLIGNR